MTARLGRLTARLAEPPDRIPAELIEAINQNINPPEPVTADLVHVRAMYVVNDRVNSFGGRFPVDEHPRLAELLVDSPVLVGHRKDKLPVARTFHAVTCEEDGEAWVKAYFYWLKSADGAESLRENIDAGIYKECSIGFTFVLAECSVCGRDIRLCDHEPFQTYSVGGSDQTCHFLYRKIERVLESSLVYRGATPNTHISRQLVHTPLRQPDLLPDDHRLSSLAELRHDVDYLLLPRYESLAVTIDRSKEKPTVRLPDGSTCYHRGLSELIQHLPEWANEGRLVGMRGKQRCRVSALLDYLAGLEGDVRRVLLYVLPPNRHVSQASTPNSLVRLIPYRFAKPSDLIRCAHEITTRLGVELVMPEQAGDVARRRWFHPEQLAPLHEDHYELLVQSNSPHAQLRLTINGDQSRFLIRQYHHPRLQRGGRFLVDQVTESVSANQPPGVVGTVTKTAMCGRACRLTLSGPLDGTYLLQPITLGGVSRLLFFRAADREADQ